MDPRLQQAVSLSLAGGFAILAPLPLPRKATAVEPLAEAQGDQAKPPIQLQSDDEAASDH